MQGKKKYHALESKEILNRFQSHPDKGLSAKEARERLQNHGPNQLRKQEQKSLIRIFIDQVNNPVIYLLLAAASISFIMGDNPEGIAITVVILLNAFIGFWMEYQAKQSMNALKKMDKIMSTVTRDKKKYDIDSEEIVPGDILDLEAGDMIPADARVVRATELQVDESPLTGESVPVEKHPGILNEDTSLADRENMLYKGTTLTDGRGKAVVVATGMDTAIGDISRMVEEAGEDEIPLNRKLNKLTHRLIWIIGGLAVAFFILGWAIGKDFYTVFQTAVAWSVAAIPEGLPIVASITLARGMLKLAKKNVIVKKLSAVETLGETTVICTDKTGTLTKNQLTVTAFQFPDGKVNVEWENDKPILYGDLQTENNVLGHVDRVSVFCNNAQVKGQIDGDPLEIALLQYVKASGKEKYENLNSQERVNEDPFDSRTKMMGTVHDLGKTYYVAAKGAAEAILERSSKIYTNKGIKNLDKKTKEYWTKTNDELSASGQRVLAYAFREASKENKQGLKSREDFVEEMVFLGLIGFLDPPRQEVKPAIEACHQAGIKVVMITGDHPATSFNIAKRIGLAKQDDQVIHGNDLEKYLIKGEEIDPDIVKTPVFARVEPEQKLRIVQDFQEAGEIVGVTGDGVNDAPALKKANIGIAMGKRGTQAAREVADMVLKDDAFPSIVEAIRQGRIIFGNIRKFISYQLSYHLSEILLIAIVSFSFFTLPLLPLQLLFLNLLSDVFPALALSQGKGDPEVMNKPPKDPGEAIVTRANWREIAIFGSIIALFVTGGYIFADRFLGLSNDIANNVAFFSLALAQFWHVFNMREDHENIWKNQVTRNKYIWSALAISVAALLAAYFIPVFNKVLSFQELDINTWLLIISISLCPLITIQLYKWARHKMNATRR